MVGCSLKTAALTLTSPEESSPRQTLYALPVVVDESVSVRDIVLLMDRLESQIASVRFQLYLDKIAEEWPSSVSNLTFGDDSEGNVTVQAHPVKGEEGATEAEKAQIDLECQDFSNKIQWAIYDEPGFAGLMMDLLVGREVILGDLPHLKEKSISPRRLAQWKEWKLSEDLPAPVSSKPSSPRL